jgi:hypothetical protein
LWFKNKDDDGLIFQEHFSPMPFPAIAIALTVIECCIDEWANGTREESYWNEERFKTVYLRHTKSLTDPDERLLGADALEEIRGNLLVNAVNHAGD